MSRRRYCTYFDEGYLPKGLALYRSLCRHAGDFELWVLCLSEACHEALTRLQAPRMRLLRLAELETFEPRLAAVRPHRTRVEYFFTCSPVLPACVFDREPSADVVTYLDSDLWFLHPPDALFEELGDGSTAIIEHDFTPDQRHREKFGRFNVGWIGFRRTRDGLACLDWWRERCLEWCHDRVDDGRFADQGYLDEWPRRFAGVRILKHPGANLAPWNIRGREVRWKGDAWTVNGRPLIFFHFHGFREVRQGLYDTALSYYGAAGSRDLTEHLFRPYLRELTEAAREAAGLLAGAGRERPPVPGRIQVSRNPVRFWWNAWRQLRRGTYLRVEP